MVSSGVAEVGMRAYFSSYHLWAAEHFTRFAKEIEDAHTGSPEFNITHRAYVTNAILSAVAFLEAAINELFDDVVDKHPSYVDPLTPECSRLLAGLWIGHEQSVERWPILDKYQIALLCSGNSAFDKSAQPYQDVQILIGLRNRLTHSRPKTRVSADAEQEKLRERMSARFRPNRLMEGAANPYFPDHHLGAGCAGWAVETVRAFAHEFFERLNIQPNYQLVNFGPA